MGGEQNRLLHRTVNPTSYGIRGSSPWPPTRIMKVNMFKVYWTFDNQNHGKEFDDMMEALDYCQLLRNGNAKFVTMCSELADMVGDFGVKETEPGYDWKKRRI